LVLDPIFPPPHFTSNKKLVHENLIEQNKFELIFDEVEDTDIIKDNKINSNFILYLSLLILNF
jgi:hypothetical protein